MLGDDSDTGLPLFERDELYRRPGFLIRRAHQIATSIFLEEMGDHNITTTQYGALVTLRAHPGLDQVGLSRRMGIDRSTAALVATNLQQAGYVKSTADANDRRRKVLVLTVAGHAALTAIAGPARRVENRELSIFTQRQADVFLDLLTRFVTAFNDEARAPVDGSSNEARRFAQRRNRADAQRRRSADRHAGTGS